MSFSKDFSAVLPRSDPSEGADNGDKLRVVVSRRAKKYISDILKDRLNAKMVARIVKAKAAGIRDRPNLSRPLTLDQLVAECTSGDTAIILRSRAGKHIRWH